MTHEYELMVILDPEIDERTVAPSLDKFLNVIRNDGGTIDNIDIWGRRRLAYEIQKKSEGIYAVVNFTATSESTVELDRQLKLSEAVLRTKVLRSEEAVAELIRLHLRFFGYSGGQWSDAAVRRYVRDAGDLLEWLHILSRADVTTRNQRKSRELATAYDELEARIATLGEEEELAAIRPDLDGEQIMAILGLKPGREVGEAYRFLLELRLDEGELGYDIARDRLLEWWATRG